MNNSGNEQKDLDETVWLYKYIKFASSQTIQVGVHTMRPGLCHRLCHVQGFKCFDFIQYP